MKKIVSILLVLVTVLSMGTMAFADGTTTLTTTVPAATYTLNIPADQTIDFGATSTNIGELSITNATGFAIGKNIAVTISYEAFKCESTATSIPFYVRLKTPITYTGSNDDNIRVSSGDTVQFEGRSDGTTKKYVQLYVIDKYYDMEEFWVLMTSEVWGKALGGDYTATITFTSEVVVE